MFIFRKGKSLSDHDASSALVVIVTDVSGQCPSISQFSCILFAICVDCDVSWCLNPNFLNNLWFLDQQIPFFYKQRDVKNSELIEQCMTTALSVSKFSTIVADASDPMTPSHLRFSHLLFAVCSVYADYDMS